ncbi:YMR189Wp-like protein [Suillus ampliporus]|nr:YMR189Wp-like protein [Suillus ampliporus]
MLQYIFHLECKDHGLIHAMVPLDSCMMKLNSTSSMIPLTWPKFGSIHLFALHEQVEGYRMIIKEPEDNLCKIICIHVFSVQLNSGAAGEYASLTVIRAYQDSLGEGHCDFSSIPVSVHGTNPALGFKFIPGQIAYPLTFGVFEDGIVDACKIIQL